MDVPSFVQEEVLSALHDAIWAAGFARSSPLKDKNFYCEDGKNTDRYIYKNTVLLECVKRDDGTYNINEYF